MRKMAARRRRVTGYTLMELLIVITIIGVLLGIAVVNLRREHRMKRVLRQQARKSVP